MADEIITVPATLFNRLKTAGQLLSNCAYNLAQKPGQPLPERTAKSLRECQTEWDAARDELRKAIDA